MSPPEIAHRLREQMRRNVSRLDRRGWNRFDLGEGPLRPLAALAAFGRRSWPAGMEVAESNLTCGGPPRFLGQTWPPGDRLDRPRGLWRKDPVSGENWPGAETYCFDVRWRDEADKADVKFTLELNRLQFLQPLAAKAMRDRDRDAARAAAETIVAWMEENPPFGGLNWLSGIELALRLVSAAFVVTALETVLPGHGFGRPLRSFIAAHAYWLRRFPSLHSSANNHLVSEGLGLLIAAELVPDLPHAARCRRVGRDILATAAHAQFFDDGTGVEQSPTYAAFTLEMILLGLMIERSHGIAPDPAIAARIERAAFHLKVLLDAGGRHPRIGDDDEGQVIAAPPHPADRYVASIVAQAAGVLGRPELAPPVRTPHLRDVLFSAPETPGTSPEGVFAFRSGGYTVVRQRLAGRAALLVMDHGPLGFGPLAAHGHADALSIWLHLDGQPVFIDAGTYRYNACGPWRERLRSSAAHNTLTIAGESQSTTAGAFNWRHKAKADLVSIDTSHDWRVAARHDGYLARFGVMHHRTCRRVGDGFLVEDSLTGATEGLDAVISLLLHPALTVSRAPHGVVVSKDGEALVRLTSQTGREFHIVGPDQADAPPVHSAAYNALAPTCRVEIRPKDFRIPHILLIEVLPRAAAAPRDGLARTTVVA